ncbi:MAG: hypothetical protein WKF83_02765 [Nocardioidaceae bacterium]
MAPATGEPERVGQIRAAGYVWTHSEVVPGAYGVAAPIAARGKIAPASVNVVSNRPDVVERAIPLVVEAAKEISRRLDAAVPAAEVRRWYQKIPASAGNNASLRLRSRHRLVPL